MPSEYYEFLFKDKWATAKEHFSSSSDSVYNQCSRCKYVCTNTEHSGEVFEDSILDSSRSYWWRGGCQRGEFKWCKESNDIAEMKTPVNVEVRNQLCWSFIWTVLEINTCLFQTYDQWKSSVPDWMKGFYPKEAMEKLKLRYEKARDYAANFTFPYKVSQFLTVFILYL